MTTASHAPPSSLPNVSSAPKCGARSWQREEYLFRSWRSGDAKASRELFRRLRGHLYPFFCARGGELAEDMLQEALVACVRARQTLDDEAALKGYVYTTARRIIARQIERRGPTTDELGESVPADEPDLHDVLDRDAALVDLHECLRSRATLSTRAAALYYLEGRRGPEIARELEIPEGTVRSRIRRGLRQLRRSLEGAGTGA